jgi:hypothetical protein
MSVGSNWEQSAHTKELLKSSSFLSSEELKAIIKDSGISRDYLGDKLGVTYNHLGRLINRIELRESKPAYEYGIRWIIQQWASHEKDQE